MIKIKHDKLLKYYDIIKGSLSEKDAKAQFDVNKEKWKTYSEGIKKSKEIRDIETDKVYIEKQWELTDMLYGRSNKLTEALFFAKHKMTAADNACEVIATYNVLQYLEDPYESSDFPELLKYYSRNGMALKGIFGTSPMAIKRFFDKNGYDTKLLIGHDITAESLDLLCKDYSAFVTMMYNEKGDISKMLHTMAITKEKKGYVLHNSYSSLIREEKLFDVLSNYNQKKGDPVCIIGVKAK